MPILFDAANAIGFSEHVGAPMITVREGTMEGLQVGVVGGQLLLNVVIEIFYVVDTDLEDSSKDYISWVQGGGGMWVQGGGVRGFRGWGTWVQGGWGYVGSEGGFRESGVRGFRGVSGTYWMDRGGTGVADAKVHSSDYVLELLLFVCLFQIHA